MDAIFPFFFIGLSIWSLIVYLKSPEKIAMRIAKGVAAFLFPIGALGAFLSGDYETAIPIACIVLFLSIRRFKLNNSSSATPSEIKPTASVASSRASASPLENEGGKSIAFEYTDANGNTTYREVDVKDISDESLTGYCHSRRQLRTFRLDRIEHSEITIRSTGELINVYDWIVQLYDNRINL